MRIHDEKNFAEKEDIVAEKPGALENADFTGAAAKTDPAEIKLVRKIDWRLMVSTRHLLSNGKSNHSSANVVYYVLPQLRRSKCHCSSAFE